MGYCGGTTVNPTYHRLSDHTETLQIDFDPTQISYQQLLDIFWASHNPARPAWSRQYKAAVFTHNDAQARLAETTKTQLVTNPASPWHNRDFHTEILPATPFYLAEDYHQKYLLQHTPRLWGEIQNIYREDLPGWINSTAAARLNGYVGGYGSAAQLSSEVERLGLSPSAQEYLWQVVRRFER